MYTCSKSTEHIGVGAAFWTYERQKGQAFPQMERKFSKDNTRGNLVLKRPYQHQQPPMSGVPSQTQLLLQHRLLRNSSRIRAIALIIHDGPGSPMTDGTKIALRRRERHQRGGSHGLSQPGSVAGNSMT
jgi:hypothetical protein